MIMELMELFRTSNAGELEKVQDWLKLKTATDRDLTKKLIEAAYRRGWDDGRRERQKNTKEKP